MDDKENKPEKKTFTSSYTRGQRIFAAAGVVLLLALYLVTLVAGITTSPAAPELFQMSLGASILLPILFWLYIRFGRIFMGKKKEEGE